MPPCIFATCHLPITAVRYPLFCSNWAENNWSVGTPPFSISRLLYPPKGCGQRGPSKHQEIASRDWTHCGVTIVSIMRVRTAVAAFLIPAIAVAQQASLSVDKIRRIEQAVSSEMARSTIPAVTVAVGNT